MPEHILMCKPETFKIISNLARVSLVLVALGPTQYSASLAQGAKSGPVTVSEVSTRASANGTVVSIAADGPLSRAQTWQDREGYHVVVPSGAAQKEIKVGNGIKVTQLDHTLEILVQTKPGASVTVQPTSNHLNLTIEGKLEPRSPVTDLKKASSPAASSGDSAAPADKERNSKTLKESAPAESNAASASSLENSSGPSYIAQGPTNGAASPLGQSRAATSDSQRRPASAEDEWSGLFSITTAVVVAVLGLLSLLFIRWRRSKSNAEIIVNDSDDFGFSDFDSIEPERKPEVETGMIKSNSTNGSNGASAQRKPVVRMPVGVPASLFGAFQVDQEVAKLVMGQPHKMEVLASRATDDRRAIEASLLKALASTDGQERRRVREALEEYGFVARQNATVLLAADPYDRTSAARMLGDIQSQSALPFLLEALYDSESIVRNQAVLSIGELRMPSAIGALLDIARKHNDVPGALLSRALSACSVEGLDFFDSPIPDSRLLSAIDVDASYCEIKELKPASAVQELPESLADEKFAEALAKIEAFEIVERAEGLKMLAQFAVRESVAALARVARRDAKPNLRALAIASLAAINHESVFPAVLIGMADESREVRAAAARALSRLSFDRADAYTRVIETDDAETLRDVAQACVKSGVASQAIDRLASTDRRHAYEAWSLVSLLAKADVLEPIMAAIVNHPRVDVRVGAVRLLGTIGIATVLQELQELALDGMPEPVKMVLAETIAKLETAQTEESHVTEAESEPVRHEMDSVECAPAPHEKHNFESQPEGTLPSCLEYVADQPPLDTSGLPALPIA